MRHHIGFVINFAFSLIVLHNVNGLPVYVNPELITSWRGPEPHSRHLFTGGLHCLVNMVDGKFITVVETCDQVRKLIEESKRNPQP